MAEEPLPVLRSDGLIVNDTSVSAASAADTTAGDYDGLESLTTLAGIRTSFAD